MKKVSITTPENIELELLLAEVLSRSAAAMIDLLIQGCISILLQFGLYAVIEQFYSTDDMFYGIVLGSAIILEVLIVYLYNIILETKWRGQTVGKRILHIRVVRDNGAPIGAKEAIIRNLFKLIIDYTGIGIIMIFFNKTNKRVGDLVAGTMVVIEEEMKRPIVLEEMVTINEEIKSCLTQEEYNLLREYFLRKATMTDYEELRSEMRSYFKEKFVALGIDEGSETFIQSI